MSDSNGSSASKRPRLNPVIVAAIIAAIGTIVAALVALLPHGGGGSTPTGGSTSSSPPASSSTGSSVTSTAFSSGSGTAGTSPPQVLYTASRDLTATYAADLDNPTWAIAPVSSQPQGADIYFDAAGELSRY